MEKCDYCEPYLECKSRGECQWKKEASSSSACCPSREDFERWITEEVGGFGIVRFGRNPPFGSEGQYIESHTRVA